MSVQNLKQVVYYHTEIVKSIMNECQKAKTLIFMMGVSERIYLFLSDCHVHVYYLVFQI